MPNDQLPQKYIEKKKIGEENFIDDHILYF